MNPDVRKRRRKKRKKIIMANIKLCAFITVFIAAVIIICVRISDHTQAQEVIQTETQAPVELDVVSTTEAEEGLPWYLTLVNSDNPAPDDLTIEFTYLDNDQLVDSRIYPELQLMLDDCRNAGLLPMIVESYRTIQEQQEIFDERVAAYVNEGYDHDQAAELVSEQVAVPGYSEHHLGLAIDVDSENTDICSNEAVWDWLAQHCAEYGFIVRYQESKKDITGISYEPWHLRYVGKEAAEAITENGLCLEEYLSLEYGYQ